MYDYFLMHSKSILKYINFLLSGKNTLLSKYKVKSIYQCSKYVYSLGKTTWFFQNRANER